MKVLHRCDNPPCCNPDHLFLGDDALNVADKIAKDRHPVGSRSSLSKIDECIAADIRRRYLAGESIAALQRTYPLISYMAVSGIAKAQKWKHVTALITTVSP